MSTVITLTIIVLLAIVAYYLWKKFQQQEEKIHSQEFIPEYLVPWHSSESNLRAMQQKYRKKMKEKKHSQQLHELGIQQHPSNTRRLRAVIRTQKNKKIRETKETFTNLEKISQK